MCDWFGQYFFDRENINLKLKIKMVLATWTTPDLSAVLSDNFTSISPIDALNDQID